MKVHMGSFLNFVLVLLRVVTIGEAKAAPHLVYVTYLCGRNKECATGVAVDRSRAAYVVGRTVSPMCPRPIILPTDIFR
jgi:hypothetical protein